MSDYFSSDSIKRMFTPRQIELGGLTPAEYQQLLQRTESDLSVYHERVKPIIEAVKSDGDAALVKFAKDFDHADITPAQIKATDADFAKARASLDAEVIEAIEYAVDNIRRYHKAQMPEEMWLKEIQPGVLVGEKWLPIPSIALYVPRGKGAFPSMVMMSAIPAVVAGVRTIGILTPPGAEGFDAATLVAAEASGVKDVYLAGGAQGVAAAAYGTETVPKFAKIEGPGSPYVVAAKQLLGHVIDPGIPAGPSESMVLADASANPEIVALDLLIEAEHGDDSSTYLVTDSRALREQVIAALPAHWATLSPQRQGFVEAVLTGKQGGLVLADSWAQAITFVNDYAPEHLQVLSQSPWADMGQIHNAGEILLGEHTPSVLANYLLGPNAILPTGGWAKTKSALSVFDFLKRSSIGHVADKGYDGVAKHTEILARYEGFDAHANAVSATRQRIWKSS